MNQHLGLRRHSAVKTPPLLAGTSTAAAVLFQPRRSRGFDLRDDLEVATSNVFQLSEAQLYVAVLGVLGGSHGVQCVGSVISVESVGWLWDSWD